jgi:hypothetical protein
LPLETFQQVGTFSSGMWWGPLPSNLPSGLGFPRMIWEKSRIPDTRIVPSQRRLDGPPRAMGGVLRIVGVPPSLTLAGSRRTPVPPEDLSFAIAPCNQAVLEYFIAPSLWPRPVPSPAFRRRASRMELSVAINSGVSCVLSWIPKTPANCDAALPNESPCPSLILDPPLAYRGSLRENFPRSRTPANRAISVGSQASARCHRPTFPPRPACPSIYHSLVFSMGLCREGRPRFHAPWLRHSSIFTVPDNTRFISAATSRPVPWLGPRQVHRISPEGEFRRRS